MEQNRNQELPPPNKPCRAGCGFYGTDASEGMCSKCYQDALKSKQAAPSSPVPSPGGRDSPPASSTPGGDCLSTGSSSPGSLSAVTASLATTSLGLGYEESRAVVASVETGSPTIPRGSAASTLTSPVQESAGQGDESQSSLSSTGLESEEGEGEERKKPKKNRCKMCKKRVGLTGFTCRCGGVFCGLHRYSDKHECEFDYREMAQHEIRKNNPVIVGEKVQKI